MKLTQVATILNNTINEAQIGGAAVVTEDLSNIVDVGKEVLNFIDSDGNKTVNYDSFIEKLIDQVGRVKFADRKYTSQAPNILKDGWEYGSILQKVRCELQDAEDNETWGLPAHISAGTYPDPFELSAPDVSAKFFNSKATYEVPITLTQVQLKEAFKSASDMSRFIAMIENRIAMKMTLCTDGLVMATICNLIGEKVASGKNVVNLIALYNDVAATPIGADDALTNPDFLKFAAKTIGTYPKYLAGASMLYNDDGYVTFTPADKLKFVALTEFTKSLDAYLYSDTYHNEFVKLPGYDEVGYWQGSGKDTSDASDREKIHVKVDVNGTATEIYQTGVMAVMFDDEAAAVCNENSRVTSIYNPRGEYTNFFYKWDAMYMNDTAENCVVFVIDDYAAEALTTQPADWGTAGKWYKKNMTNGAFTDTKTDTFAAGTYYRKVGA